MMRSPARKINLAGLAAKAREDVAAGARQATGGTGGLEAPTSGVGSDTGGQAISATQAPASA